PAGEGAAVGGRGPGGGGRPPVGGGGVFDRGGAQPRHERGPAGQGDRRQDHARLTRFGRHRLLLLRPVEGARPGGPYARQGVRALGGKSLLVTAEPLPRGLETGGAPAIALLAGGR